MENAEVIEGGGGIPTEIHVPASELQNLPMSGKQMRELKEASGYRIDQLVGDGPDAADLDVKQTALAWLALRRRGYKVTWDQADEVVVHIDDVVPDPPNAVRSIDPST